MGWHLINVNLVKERQHMQFNDVPLYSYLSGQENLVQYSVIINPDASLYFNNENSGLAVQQVNTSSYIFSLLNTVDITHQDFANTSNLARDVGTGVTKTLIWLKTHYVNSSIPPGIDIGIVLDGSVGSYQTIDQNDDPEGIITSFNQAGVRMIAGISLLSIVSSINDVRS